MRTKPNSTQYYIIRRAIYRRKKLNLMKHAAKRFLLNNSIFVPNAPHFKTSCKTYMLASPVKLNTPQIAPQIENSIHSPDTNSVKINSTNSSNKASNWSKNSEQIHSTNLSAANQFDNKSYKFERIANKFINIIWMPRKSNQPNTPNRVHCD